MKRWDAMVVGAGPAGCAAAYDLAAAGYAVLVLDRAEFPRHKACAGGLTRKSLQALRYSVAPVTREMVATITVEKGRGEAATLGGRNPLCAMTVRAELDDYCLRQTVAAGAEFARIGTIAALEADDKGVTLTAREGRFRAGFLVGADGVHSRIRQLLCGETPTWLRRGFALEARVRLADRPPSDLIFEFGMVRHGYGWIFPKRDHVNAGLYTDDPGERIDRGRLLAWIAERYEGAASVEQVTGQYLGFGAENFESRSGSRGGGRVFLVGDAGGFADPLTGEGIHGAIVSGQAAAAAIDTALSEGISAAEAFAVQTLHLRRDLRLSARGARWFYANFDFGFHVLTAPVFRRALVSAYADGKQVASLANAVRRFSRMFSINA